MPPPAPHLSLQGPEEDWRKCLQEDEKKEEDEKEEEEEEDTCGLLAARLMEQQTPFSSSIDFWTNHLSNKVFYEKKKKNKLCFKRRKHL